MSQFIKIKHDTNGNPRHVTSWLGYGFTTYAQAIEAAHTLGGRKYHTKAFGGGLVFQAYEGELPGIAERLAQLAKA